MPEHSARRRFGEAMPASAAGSRPTPRPGHRRIEFGVVAGKSGSHKRVTARGMARAVTDTTFGGKGEDRSVAGGVISYGVDSILAVTPQHNRSNRIRSGVHWGPLAPPPKHRATPPRHRIGGAFRQGACGILLGIPDGRIRASAVPATANGHAARAAADRIRIAATTRRSALRSRRSGHSTPTRGAGIPCMSMGITGSSSCSWCWQPSPWACCC